MKKVYEMNRREKNINGSVISYYELGNKSMGKTTILIHCSWYNGTSMFDYGTQWAKDTHVVVIDLPSHFKNRNDGVNNFDHLTDIIAQFIQELEAEGVINSKPMLQGWSIGGSLSLSVAINYPTLLGEVVLLCSGHSWLHTTFPDMKSKFVRDCFFHVCFRLVQAKTTPKERLKEIIKNKNSYLAEPSACQCDTDMLRVFDMTKNLHKIQVPVYALHAGQDKLSSKEMQQSLHNNIQNITYRTVEDFSHMCILEQPENAYKAVKELFVM